MYSVLRISAKSKDEQVKLSKALETLAAPDEDIFDSDGEGALDMSSKSNFLEHFGEVYTQLQIVIGFIGENAKNVCEELDVAIEEFDYLDRNMVSWTYPSSLIKLCAMYEIQITTSIYP